MCFERRSKGSWVLRLVGQSFQATTVLKTTSFRVSPWCKCMAFPEASCYIHVLLWRKSTLILYIYKLPKHLLGPYPHSLISLSSWEEGPLGKNCKIVLSMGDHEKAQGNYESKRSGRKKNIGKFLGRHVLGRKRPDQREDSKNSECGPALCSGTFCSDDNVDRCY